MPKASYIVLIFRFGHPAKSDGQPNQEVVGHMASSPKKLFLTLIMASDCALSAWYNYVITQQLGQLRVY